jgi:hypothetical protein
MADPVLQVPVLPVGFLTKYLDRAPPAGSTFVASVNTAAAAIVWTAPGFPRANFAAGGYPTNPTLATPAIPAGTHHALLYAAVPPPVGSAFPGSVTTAQAAVVWPRPAYPHANFAAGGYP